MNRPSTTAAGNPELGVADVEIGLINVDYGRMTIAAKLIDWSPICVSWQCRLGATQKQNNTFWDLTVLHRADFMMRRKEE